MKKIFVFIACLALVLFTAGVVSAAAPHDPTTGTTEVIYTVSSTYVLQVPSELFVNEDGRTLEVKIYNGRIAGNQKIVVNVSSTQFERYALDKNGDDVGGLWVLKSEGNDKLYYHIHRITASDTIPVKNGEMVYEVSGNELALAATDANNRGLTEFYCSGNIDIHLDSIETHSGEFTDTLSFTSEVVDST